MTAEESLKRLHKSYDSYHDSTIHEEERQTDEHLSNRLKKKILKQQRKLQLNIRDKAKVYL